MGAYDEMSISELGTLLKAEITKLRDGIERLVAREGELAGLAEIERALGGSVGRDPAFRHLQQQIREGHAEDLAETGASGDPLAELAKLIGKKDPFSNFESDTPPADEEYVPDPRRDAFFHRDLPRFADFFNP